MKNLWILILCFGIINFSKAATITSTSGGGNWSSNATWVGNTIPTSSDDVVINGPVNAPSGSTTVNSLVVNSGGILRNLPSYSSTLLVNQNVINNGAIVNNTSGFLNLNIQGNIENNGLIRINRLNLEGTGKVNLTQGNNGHFGNMTIYIYTNDTLHLKSDSKFDTITWYGSGVIDAGNYHLTFHSTTIRDQKISGNGIFTMDNSTFYNTELKGNAEIRGIFSLQWGYLLEAT